MCVCVFVCLFVCLFVWLVGCLFLFLFTQWSKHGLICFFFSKHACSQTPPFARGGLEKPREGYPQLVIDSDVHVGYDLGFDP